MRPNWNPRCFCRILWQPVTCFQLFFFFSLCCIQIEGHPVEKWPVRLFRAKLMASWIIFFFPSLPFFFDCPSEKGTRIVFLGTSGHLTGQLQFPNISTSNEWMKRRISFFFFKKKNELKMGIIPVVNQRSSERRFTWICNTFHPADYKEVIPGISGGRLVDRCEEDKFYSFSDWIRKLPNFASKRNTFGRCVSCVLDHYTNLLVIIGWLAWNYGKKGKRLFRSLNKWNDFLVIKLFI